MCDGCYALWQWSPEVGVIAKEKAMKERLDDVELKLPPEWQSEISEEAFIDNMDVLKQMESLVSGMIEEDDWMEPVQIDFH